jgi:predicted adenylyl cyclase CyaB
MTHERVERAAAPSYLATSPASEKTLGGTNLELKARVESLSAIRERLRSLDAELQGVERQDDRYFNVPVGRLKLRVSSRDGAHLVAYLRPEGERFRPSRFQRLPAADPEALAETLSAMLGAAARVVKTREVWWWRDVRVHLDEVEGRGSFVELEARVDRIGDPREAIARLGVLCHALMLSTADDLRGSYGDMPCQPTT